MAGRVRWWRCVRQPATLCPVRKQKRWPLGSNSFPLFSLGSKLWDGAAHIHMGLPCSAKCLCQRPYRHSYSVPPAWLYIRSTWHRRLTITRASRNESTSSISSSLLSGKHCDLAIAFKMFNEAHHLTQDFIFTDSLSLLVTDLFWNGKGRLSLFLESCWFLLG